LSIERKKNKTGLKKEEKEKILDEMYTILPT
jgi:hypothetical protein